MSNTVTRTLVATLGRLDIDFPASSPHRNRNFLSSPGIIAAQYLVDLDAVTTKLGRFLAEHTETTRRDDDASRVVLLPPETVGDALIAQVARDAGVGEPTLSASSGRTLERLAKMKAAIARIEGRIKMYGSASVDTHRTYRFEWPVFGSLAVRDAETPEAYYDACGTLIRKSGAVIVAAGLAEVPLPDSLARSMCGGRGLALLHNIHRSRPQ